MEKKCFCSFQNYIYSTVSYEAIKDSTFSGSYCIHLSGKLTDVYVDLKDKGRNLLNRNRCLSGADCGAKVFSATICNFSPLMPSGSGAPKIILVYKV